ncbi:MAG TPA: hypothetical protein VF142_12220 [Longimicrobium sp.]
MRVVILPGFMFLALLGCGGNQEPRDREPVNERRPTVVAWDTLWVRGGEADSLLLMPLDVVADAERGYVLDGGGKRVVALRLADGAVAWKVGGAGAGPQEFAAPTALALTPAGEVLVADHQNARISVIDRSGHVAGHVPFREFTYVQGLCALADGDVLVATMEAERPIVRISREGEVKQRLDLPWPELRNVPPLARQAFLAGTADHRECALALAVGRGLAVYRDGDFQAVTDYVESVAPPQVDVASRRTDGGHTQTTRMRRPDIAATDVAADVGTVAVSFQGKSRSAGKIIDHYDLRTGLYLESYEFTRPIQSLARVGNRYLLLHESAGYPTLVAVVPATSPSSVAAR